MKISIMISQTFHTLMNGKALEYVVDSNVRPDDFAELTVGICNKVDGGSDYSPSEIFINKKWVERNFEEEVNKRILPLEKKVKEYERELSFYKDTDFLI